MNPTSLRQPPLETLGNGLAVVNRGIVHDHQREVVRAHVREVVQRRDDLRAPEPAGGRVKIGFIRPIEQAQNGPPVPTATGKFVGDPRRLPGIGYAGDQVKAGGINIETVDLVTGRRRL